MFRERIRNVAELWDARHSCITTKRERCIATRGFVNAAKKIHLGRISLPTILCNDERRERGKNKSDNAANQLLLGKKSTARWQPKKKKTGGGEGVGSLLEKRGQHPT